MVIQVLNSKLGITWFGIVIVIWNCNVIPSLEFKTCMTIKS